MNKHETPKMAKHLTVALAALGALSLAIVVPPAFALTGSAHSSKAQLTPQHTLLQLADEDDDNPAPFVRHDEDEDSAEHARHEEMEEHARERAHRFAERQEERAQRLQDRLNRERAEHERHEMNEHRDNDD